MKYEKGDKFIIEIDKELATGLYRVKGCKTFVLDMRVLNRLEQVQEHDGCDGCEYFPKAASDYPCYDCKQNYKDKWAPKTEEIQVGDEVEHIDGWKGVVYSIGNTTNIEHRYLRILRCGADSFYKDAWNEEFFTRTGKTYPELIKVLEELPKEGE